MGGIFCAPGARSKTSINSPVGPVDGSDMPSDAERGHTERDYAADALKQVAVLLDECHATRVPVTVLSLASQAVRAAVVVAIDSRRLSLRLARRAGTKASVALRGEFSPLTPVCLTFTIGSQAHCCVTTIERFNEDADGGSSVLHVRHPQMLASIECRRNARVPVLEDSQLSVVIDHQGLHPVVARDLSVQGIQTDMPARMVSLPRRTALPMTLKFRDIEISQYAMIRRITNKRAGFCFVDPRTLEEVEPSRALGELVQRVEAEWVRYRMPRSA